MSDDYPGAVRDGEQHPLCVWCDRPIFPVQRIVFAATDDDWYEPVHWECCEYAQLTPRPLPGGPPCS